MDRKVNGTRETRSYHMNSSRRAMKIKRVLRRIFTENHNNNDESEVDSSRMISWSALFKTPSTSTSTTIKRGAFLHSNSNNDSDESDNPDGEEEADIDAGEDGEAGDEAQDDEEANVNDAEDENDDAQDDEDADEPEDVEDDVDDAEDEVDEPDDVEDDVDDAEDEVDEPEDVEDDVDDAEDEVDEPEDVEDDVDDGEDEVDEPEDVEDDVDDGEDEVDEPEDVEDDVDDAQNDEDEDANADDAEEVEDDAQNDEDEDANADDAEEVEDDAQVEDEVDDAEEAEDEADDAQNDEDEDANADDAEDVEDDAGDDADAVEDAEENSEVEDEPDADAQDDEEANDDEVVDDAEDNPQAEGQDEGEVENEVEVEDAEGPDGLEDEPDGEDANDANDQDAEELADEPDGENEPEMDGPEELEPEVEEANVEDAAEVDDKVDEENEPDIDGVNIEDEVDPVNEPGVGGEDNGADPDGVDQGDEEQDDEKDGVYGEVNAENIGSDDVEEEEDRDNGVNEPEVQEVTTTQEGNEDEGGAEVEATQEIVEEGQPVEPELEEERENNFVADIPAQTGNYQEPDDDNFDYKTPALAAGAGLATGMLAGAVMSKRSTPKVNATPVPKPVAPPSPPKKRKAPPPPKEPSKIITKEEEKKEAPPDRPAPPKKDEPPAKLNNQKPAKPPPPQPNKGGRGFGFFGTRRADPYTRPPYNYNGGFFNNIMGGPNYGPYYRPPPPPPSQSSGITNLFNNMGFNPFNNSRKIQRAEEEKPKVQQTVDYSIKPAESNTEGTEKKVEESKDDEKKEEQKTSGEVLVQETAAKQGEVNLDESPWLFQGSAEGEVKADMPSGEARRKVNSIIVKDGEKTESSVPGEISHIRRQKGRSPSVPVHVTDIDSDGARPASSPSISEFDERQRRASSINSQIFFREYKAPPKQVNRLKPLPNIIQKDLSKPPLLPLHSNQREEPSPPPPPPRPPSIEASPIKPDVHETTYSIEDDAVTQRPQTPTTLTEDVSSNPTLEPEPDTYSIEEKTKRYPRSFAYFTPNDRNAIGIPDNFQIPYEIYGKKMLGKELSPEESLSLKFYLDKYGDRSLELLKAGRTMTGNLNLDQQSSTTSGPPLNQEDSMRTSGGAKSFESTFDVSNEDGQLKKRDTFDMSAPHLMRSSIKLPDDVQEARTITRKRVPPLRPVKRPTPMNPLDRVFIPMDSDGVEETDPPKATPPPPVPVKPAGYRPGDYLQRKLPPPQRPLERPKTSSSSFDHRSRVQPPLRPPPMARPMTSMKSLDENQSTKRDSSIIKISPKRSSNIELRLKSNLDEILTNHSPQTSQHSTMSELRRLKDKKRYRNLVQDQLRNSSRLITPPSKKMTSDQELAKTKSPLLNEASRKRISFDPTTLEGQEMSTRNFHAPSETPHKRPIITKRPATATPMPDGQPQTSRSSITGRPQTSRSPPLDAEVILEETGRLLNFETTDENFHIHQTRDRPKSSQHGRQTSNDMQPSQLQTKFVFYSRDSKSLQRDWNFVRKINNIFDLAKTSQTPDGSVKYTILNVYRNGVSAQITNNNNSGNNHQTKAISKR